MEQEKVKEELLRIFKEKHFQGDSYHCYQSKKKNWIVGYTNDYPLQHGKGFEWIIPEEVAEMLVGRFEQQVRQGVSLADETTDRKVEFYYHEMFDEEIGVGEKLQHGDKIFEVKAFRILGTPRVWDGWQWHLLANCKRVD